MSTRAKRRRTDTDEESGNPRSASPPEVVSSGEAAAAVANQEPALLEPILEEIPQIVQDIQDGDENKVVDAFQNLLPFVIYTINENNNKNRNEAFIMGAHTATLAAMRKYRRNQDVQMNACAILQALAIDNDKRTGKVGVALVKSGAVEAAVNAMILFPNTTGVLAKACLALQIIFSGCHQTAIVHCMRRFVHDLGGVELVIKAMDQFPNDENVQIGGCGLFGNLSTLQELHKTMVKAGVVRVVGAALEKHDDEDVKDSCKFCLRNFSR